MALAVILRWKPSVSTSTQNRVIPGCHQVQPLPHKVHVDDTKYNACHAKWHCMSPSRGGTQSESRCHQVLRLPRKVKVDVTKCHACHTNSCNVHLGQTGPKRATRANPVPYVPRLQHKVKVDVPKCHACHTNSWGDNGGKREPSAPPEPTQCHTCHACQAKWRWMSPGATPAKQSEGRCRQVPRLPHKQPRRQRDPSAPPEPALCHKCHACHAKCQVRLSPSAHACHTNSLGRSNRGKREPSCALSRALHSNSAIRMPRAHDSRQTWRWMSNQDLSHLEPAKSIVKFRCLAYMGHCWTDLCHYKQPAATSRACWQWHRHRASRLCHKCHQLQLV